MRTQKKPVLFILVALVLIAGLFIFYNVEHTKLRCSIDPYKVSEIEIFNGNTGKRYKITGQSNIEHIVKNLDSITFVKEKSSKNYSGFSFSTVMKDKGGKILWNCTINSSDTIIYNEYFYKDNSSSIDYDYIKNLLATQNPIS